MFYGLTDDDSKNIFYAYNSALTLSTGVFGNGSDNTGSATVGNYGMIGATNTNTTDALSSSLVATSGPRRTHKYMETIAQNPSYVIFAGGINLNSTAGTARDAYDASLTRSTGTLATAMTYYSSGASTSYVGNYAVFSAGVDKDLVVFNTSLTQQVLSGVSLPSKQMQTVNAGGFAWFIPGLDSGSNVMTTPYILDAALTLTPLESFAQGRYEHGVCAVGSYVLLGGGRVPGGSRLNSVEAYTTG